MVQSTMASTIQKHVGGALTRLDHPHHKAVSL
jgi:hypothetical protein